MEPKSQSYILDDVFFYLLSVNKEQRRSILYVEDIRELEIVSIIEQLLRVEKESSYGMNYSESESESGYGEAEKHKGHPHKKQKSKSVVNLSVLLG